MAARMVKTGMAGSRRQRPQLHMAHGVAEAGGVHGDLGQAG